MTNQSLHEEATSSSVSQAKQTVTKEDFLDILHRKNESFPKKSQYPDNNQMMTKKTKMESSTTTSQPTQQQQQQQEQQKPLIKFPISFINPPCASSACTILSSLARGVANTESCQSPQTPRNAQTPVADKRQPSQPLPHPRAQNQRRGSSPTMYSTASPALPFNRAIPTLAMAPRPISASPHSYFVAKTPSTPLISQNIPENNFASKNSLTNIITNNNNSNAHLLKAQPIFSKVLNLQSTILPAPIANVTLTNVAATPTTSCAHNKHVERTPATATTPLTRPHIPIVKREPPSEDRSSSSEMISSPLCMSPMSSSSDDLEIKPVLEALANSGAPFPSEKPTRLVRVDNLQRLAKTFTPEGQFPPHDTIQGIFFRVHNQASEPGQWFPIPFAPVHKQVNPICRVHKRNFTMGECKLKKYGIYYNQQYELGITTQQGDYITNPFNLKPRARKSQTKKTDRTATKQQQTQLHVQESPTPVIPAQMVNFNPNLAQKKLKLENLIHCPENNNNNNNNNNTPASSLTDLPESVLAKIFFSLPYSNFGALQLVNRKARQVLQNNEELWCQKYVRDFPTSTKTPGSTTQPTWRQLYQSNFPRCNIANAELIYIDEVQHLTKTFTPHAQFPCSSETTAKVWIRCIDTSSEWWSIPTEADSIFRMSRNNLTILDSHARERGIFPHKTYQLCLVGTNNKVYLTNKFELKPRIRK